MGSSVQLDPSSRGQVLTNPRRCPTASRRRLRGVCTGPVPLPPRAVRSARNYAPAARGDRRVVHGDRINRLQCADRRCRRARARHGDGAHPGPHGPRVTADQVAAGAAVVQSAAIVAGGVIAYWRLRQRFGLRPSLRLEVASEYCCATTGTDRHLILKVTLTNDGVVPVRLKGDPALPHSTVGARTIAVDAAGQPRWFGVLALFTEGPACHPTQGTSADLTLRPGDTYRAEALFGHVPTTTSGYWVRATTRGSSRRRTLRSPLRGVKDDEFWHSHAVVPSWS
jgi:hypothetical protein